MNPELRYVALEKLHGVPPGVDWHEPNIEGWQAIYQRFGMIRPLVVSRRSGNVLNPPGEYEALIVSRQSANAVPRGIRLDEDGGWSVPVALVDVEPDDQAVMSLILAGGVDRALLPRMKDESVLNVLLSTAEKELGAVKTFGIDLRDLGEILEAVSEGDESAPALPSVAGDLERGEWGIPCLDPTLQADALYPAVKWGTVKRDTLLPGCLIHFYTDDSKFVALLKDASPVVAAQPAAVVEPNFSTSVHMPGALALYRIYQKRTLAAQWQAHGLRLLVDLNVDRAWFNLNLLGVPTGWRAYTNRARSADLEHLEAAYQLACERRGNDDVLYLVYGGGQKVRQLCEARGWTWLPEDSDSKRGR